MTATPKFGECNTPNPISLTVLVSGHPTLAVTLDANSGQHFTLSPLKGNSPCLKRGRGCILPICDISAAKLFFPQAQLVDQRIACLTTDTSLILLFGDTGQRAK